MCKHLFDSPGNNFDKLKEQVIESNAKPTRNYDQLQALKNHLQIQMNHDKVTCEHLKLHKDPLNLLEYQIKNKFFKTGVC